MTLDPILWTERDYLWAAHSHIRRIFNFVSQWKRIFWVFLNVDRNEGYLGQRRFSRPSLNNSIRGVWFSRLKRIPVESETSDHEHSQIVKFQQNRKDARKITFWRLTTIRFSVYLTLVSGILRRSVASLNLIPGLSLRTLVPCKWIC